MIDPRKVHRLQHGFRFAVLLLMSISLLSTVQIAQAAVFQPGCSNGVGDTAALQAAFNSASNNGADDTIQLVAGCTYTLSATLTANLIDGKTLTIEGNNATISGNNAVRVLKVNSGSTVIINKTKLSKGFTDEQSNSDGEGAAIANEGTLTLNKSTVSGSLATNGGGGGILNDQGTLTLNKTTISGNTLNSGDGGGILNKDGAVTITDSVISGNTATNGGGGIYNNDGGTLTVRGSTISGNNADWGGGLANLGTANVTKSLITDNTAITSGGGIDNSGSLTLVEIAVSGNDVPEGDGGGILSANGGTLNVNKSSITDNTADNWGGGMAVFGVSVSLTNSTIYNNTASFGGGIGNNNTGVVTLRHVTLSGNTGGGANQGGGIYNEGTVNLTNSIFANSTVGGDCINNGGTFNPNSVNLVEDGSCVLLNGISGDPMLGNPVGQPVYLPLLAGSPALDAGLNNAVNCPDSDQRGELRPQDGNNDGNLGCDLGAFELGMIVNGGFEDGTTGWKVSNPATGKVKCNKPTKQLANGGYCAFMFKGAGKVTQKITDVTLNPGASMQLRLFYWGKGNTINAKVKLRVKYTDGTETGKLNPVLSTSDGYTELVEHIVIDSAAINKIKIVVNNSSPAGKLYIDDVSLTPTSNPLFTIPLP